MNDFEDLKYMKYVSIADLAAYIGVSYQKIYERYKRGNTNLVRIYLDRGKKGFNIYNARNSKEIFFTGVSAYNYAKDQLCDKT